MSHGYFQVEADALRTLAVLRQRFPGAAILDLQPPPPVMQAAPGAPALAPPAGAPQPAPAVAAEVDAQAAALLAQAQGAYQAGDLPAAIATLNTLLNLPP